MLEKSMKIMVEEYRDSSAELIDNTVEFFKEYAEFTATVKSMRRRHDEIKRTLTRDVDLGETLKSVQRSMPDTPEMNDTMLELDNILSKMKVVLNKFPEAVFFEDEIDKMM